MSYYRDRLQDIMLKSSKVEKLKSSATFQPFNFSTFYAVCEAVAYAAFLSGWLIAILSHV